MTKLKNIKSNARGQIDTDHLREFCTEDVAALMLTNPSTLGAFEERIAEIAAIPGMNAARFVHGRSKHDNVLAGVTRPGDFGVDVMHLNLHKNVFDASWRRWFRAQSGTGEEHS